MDGEGWPKSCWEEVFGLIVLQLLDANLRRKYAVATSVFCLKKLLFGVLGSNL
jgi:hypothetical protein